MEKAREMTEKDVKKNWIKLPKMIDVAVFLNGDAYLNPESISFMKKAIMEYKLNKK